MEEVPIRVDCELLPRFVGVIVVVVRVYNKVLEISLLITFVESFTKRLPKKGPIIKFMNENNKNQPHGVDCGAFISYYALKVMQGVLPQEVAKNPLCNPQQMLVVRRWMRHELTPLLTDKVYIKYNNEFRVVFTILYRIQL